MLKIVDAKTMQAIEQETGARYGVPGQQLMEQAGLRLAEQVMRWVAADPRARVAVLAGPGKNGGDGLVCARYLARAKVKVLVLLLAEKLAPETLANLQRLTSENVAVKRSHETFPPEFSACLETADCVVDALLGIGLSGPPREPMASAIRALNLSKAMVVAADVPSGLNCDTGAAYEPCVRAHATITFGLPKAGLLASAAAAQVGQLVVEPLGFPEPLLRGDGDIQYCDVQAVAQDLPVRPAAAHKRSAGKVLVIGGSAQYHGALLLAARGAMLAGAGLVTLAYPKVMDAAVRSHMLEALCCPLPATSKGVLGLSAWPQLEEWMAGHDAMVLGPGLGREKSCLDLVRRIVRELSGGKSLVVDADALQAIAGCLPSPRSQTPAHIILTPHAGEAAGILGLTSQQVEVDRVAAIRGLVHETKATVLLKGRHTLVSQEGAPVYVMGSGTQALATAGTGDVLSGVIAALASQGMAPLSASLLGASLHGLAGRLSCPDPMGLGTTAGRVAEHLPQAIEHMRKLPRMRGE